jgi:hypothetical protein
MGTTSVVHSPKVTLGDVKSAPTLTGKVTLGTATNGLIEGCGTSGANAELGITAGNALEYYLNASHTSGDMRGEYLRLYFSGAGGTGEALRAYSTLNNVASGAGGTINGAHITMDVHGASGVVAGAANALRVTFSAGAAANPGGTCATIQVDTDFDNAATVPANFAFLRFTNSNTKISANLLRIPNASNGTLLAAHTVQTMTHSIKCVSEDGTAYYLMATNAATNRL